MSALLLPDAAATKCSAASYCQEISATVFDAATALQCLKPSIMSKLHISAMPSPMESSVVCTQLLHSCKKRQPPRQQQHGCQHCEGGA
jgi:hypothetical protein